MKKKFKDLTLEDFPEINVDTIKFEEWKKARETMNRNLIGFGIFFLLLNIVLFILLGYIWGGGILLIFILFFIMKKFNKLTKELGIKPKMIRQALKGGK